MDQGWGEGLGGWFGKSSGVAGEARVDSRTLLTSFSVMKDSGFYGIKQAEVFLLLL